MKTLNASNLKAFAAISNIILAACLAFVLGIAPQIKAQSVQNNGKAYLEAMQSFYDRCQATAYSTPECKDIDDEGGY